MRPRALRGRFVCGDLALEIDDNAAHWQCLARQDMAFLFVIGSEGVGAILLDRAFQQRHLARPALAGTA